MEDLGLLKGLQAPMVGLYQRRWSNSAKWCERIATVCLPYFAISIILHRTGQISSPQAFWLIGFGLVMIFASLALGIRAFLDLWYSGQRGGKATIRGVILGLLMLGPFIWFGYLAVAYPLISDVSTNPYSPPEFMSAGELRERLAGEGINQLATYDLEYANLLIEAYPDIGSRRYNAGAQRIYQAVRQLVTERHWTITGETGLPEDRPVGEEDEPADSGNSGHAPEGVTQLETASPLNVEIEAVASSMIYAFKRDIVIQIVAEEETTLVDMRASTRWGRHDFGMDASVIRSFLADLDKTLLGIAGEG